MTGPAGTARIGGFLVRRNRFMKRFLTAALVAGVFSTFGLAGCAEKSEVTTTEKVTTPGGTTTTTDEKKIESKGDNPPPSTGGEKVEPPK
jgi:hypothetical protein